MLGDSAVLGGASSGDAVAVVPATAASAAPAADGNNTHDAAAAAGGGGGGSNSVGEEDSRRGEEGDRSFSGNRWPRQETLALLKIRLDMDVAFRDASVKGPLWEEVSRKLAELGYHRSAKKCKEKFENVYKYHKRTKEGRTGKSDGKAYRFFDQLEALDHNHPSNIQSFSTPSSKPQQALSPTPVSVAAPLQPPPIAAIMPPPTVLANSNTVLHVNTVPSTTTTPTTINPTIPSYPPQNFLPLTANPTPNPIPPSFPSISADLLSNSSSSSTSSEETLEGNRKRKRKWKDFFERLMKEVIDKQEELQKRFLEAIEKREHERMVREEAWRMQEMARINREREILAQERSIAAAKDAAVMAFLQKIAEQQNLGHPLNNINSPQPQPPHPQPQPQAQPQPQPPPQPRPPQTQALTVAVAPQPTAPAATVVSVQQPLAASPPVTVLPLVASQRQVVTSMEIIKADNGENFMATSSSRWPKVEVQALIKLRTDLDAKYQETGPKGPLWEEISTEMKKIGYNRSAKRCKEKWENINKYFKKVKESNRKRPEDSKTCPYFHQLDALYREKNKLENPSSSSQMKPENMTTPLMVRPEQQWPPQRDLQRSGTDVTMREVDKPMDRNIHEDEDEEDDEDKDGDEDDEEDGGGGNYEIVASKPASVSEAE